jgi:hypothetical protein
MDARTHEGYFSATMDIHHEDFLQALEGKNDPPMAKFLVGRTGEQIIPLAERAKAIQRAMTLSLPHGTGLVERVTTEPSTKPQAGPRTTANTNEYPPQQPEGILIPASCDEEDEESLMAALLASASAARDKKRYRV